MRNLRKFLSSNSLEAWKNSDNYITPNVILYNNTIQFNKRQYDAKIEYLASTKTQYIDINIVPDENTGIYIKASYEDNSDLYAVGMRNDTNNTRWLIGKSVDGWYYGYGTYANTNEHLPKTNTIAECKLNYLNSKKWEATGNNNDTISCNLPTLSFTPAYNIRLFGSAGIVKDYTHFLGKIYFVKISQGSEIIMDLIPVRIGNIGYMYDKISKKLYGNDGDGDFILGEDIVEIEYLESTGTQYINTDSPNIYNYGLSGEIKMQRTGDSTGEKAYIGRTTAGGFELYTKSDMGISLWVDRGATSFEVTAGSTYFDKNIHYITFNITRSKTYLSIDGNQYSVTDNANTAGAFPIQLFSHRNYYNSEGRIYYCKLYYNSVLIYDFIPVRIGQVGYMYDKISNKLYGNNGEGNFILGADKK